MTSWPRFVWVMGRAVVHVLLAVFLVALVFPFLSLRARRALIRWWSAHVLRIFRVTVRIARPTAFASATVIDAVLERGSSQGAMLVMNHISWLDVYLIHALRPARFIAKSEIARWPVLGYLTDRTGALFIERGKRHAVREVNHRAAALMRGGDLIGMFPEGTTSDGDRLLPFHANLIQPAIDGGVPVIVAGLRYRDAKGRRTTATSYVGETSMLTSIVRIARHGPLIAELHLIDTIATDGATRHAIAREARTAIAASMGFDDEADEAREGWSTVVVVPDDEDAMQRRFREYGPGGTGPETVLDPRDELL